MKSAEFRTPGLTGDWLTTWLAALGVTVLVDGARLRWTGERVPAAVLVTPAGLDLVEAIVAALPSPEDLATLAIARPTFSRQVDLQQYQAAATTARSTRDFSLAISVTDLSADPKDGRLPHSRFDPAAPQGKTLWDRLLTCRLSLDETPSIADAVADTISGLGTRVKGNGLGLDIRRLRSADQPDQDLYVDPVLECLTFFGLALFPIRRVGNLTAWPRGWIRSSGFFWPTWTPALDRWGIDALLGILFGLAPGTWPKLSLGVTAAYEAIEFKKTGDMDQTSGFASRRVL